MKRTQLSAREIQRIDAMVKHFEANKARFDAALGSLTSYVTSSEALAPLIHSFKRRVKDPEHLRAKLVRKFLEAKESGKRPDYSVDNLFTKVNDLAGFRIIHLHTTQFASINVELLKIFEDQRWIVSEGPVAKTWDDETRRYFQELSMATEESKTMYTSVHYVVKPNSRQEITCEIQVRTLMEEVWGEVDHTINYPEKSPIPSCREQILVLARMTSACSRLVDSIFMANAERSAAARTSGSSAPKRRIRGSHAPALAARAIQSDERVSTSGQSTS